MSAIYKNSKLIMVTENDVTGTSTYVIESPSGKTRRLTETQFALLVGRGEIEGINGHLQGDKVEFVGIPKQQEYGRRQSTGRQSVTAQAHNQDSVQLSDLELRRIKELVKQSAIRDSRLICEYLPTKEAKKQFKSTQIHKFVGRLMDIDVGILSYLCSMTPEINPIYQDIEIKSATRTTDRLEKQAVIPAVIFDSAGIPVKIKIVAIYTLIISSDFSKMAATNCAIAIGDTEEGKIATATNTCSTFNEAYTQLSNML